TTSISASCSCRTRTICARPSAASRDSSNTGANATAPDSAFRFPTMKPIQAGLLGIGTVGSGTFEVLKRNQEEIRRRAGRGIEITMVADLDVARARSVVGDGVKVVADAREVIAN